ncbi:MAG: hypothetical protein NVS3B8_16540 [Chitinophagaceae bacterium]
MPPARTQMLENFLDELNLLLPHYQVKIPLRLSAFLAQGALAAVN